MPRYAKTQIVGHITEPKQFGENGISFSVAFNYKMKNRDTDVVTWFRCALFDKPWFLERAQKGTLVLVEGVPVMTEYTTKDGEVRQSLELKECRAVILSGGADVSGGEGSEGGGELPF